MFRRKIIPPILRKPGSVAVAVLAATAAFSLGAEEEKIDLSIEPPRVISPDYSEKKSAFVESGAVAFGPIAPASRQPSGALSGRVIFTNGGHGWTFDPSAWRLLRGVGQQMNEDYGNVDQMNFFAAYCFNAGAVVVPFRPLGQQTNEVVLDNDDAAVSYSGAWSNSDSPIFYGSAGDVPYRFATLAAAESATATYTPSIPVAGFYPVYTWVRHGSDRGDQLYRVRHTGGESQIRIPHYKVGNGWVYLGEYYFATGSNPATGSVVISNLRASAAGNVVIADAIRFGNGMGSIDRGGGVSGYPREDESARYWIQNSLGQGQASSLYDGGGNDESDSWSAPPKMSAEMNREEGGTFFERIHVSFHSNAGGGRGTLGLITNDPTPNQAALAQLCGREVTDDLVALGSPPLEVPWSNRTTVTYSGGYSELDNSLFNGEMDATIIEVAFHDSVEDAKLLRDSKARAAVGKAAMHAVIKYMNRFAAVPLNFPPESPLNPRTRGAVDGSITLEWTPPVSIGGSGAPTGYVIYHSLDGYGFGSPILLGNVVRYSVSGLAAGTDHYFRVAAFNAGGESLPSTVAACRTALGSSDPKVLVVNAFERFDRAENPRQDVVRQSYLPPGVAVAGAIDRVWPRRANSFDYIVQHGKALSAASMAFDSCQSQAVAAGSVALKEYPIVDWACGQESTVDETFSTAEQLKIAEFRAGGGALFVSGSEIGWDLDRASGPAAGDRAFFASQLKAHLASDSNDNSLSYNVAVASTSIFGRRSGAAFEDGSHGNYRVQTPDVLTPAGSVAALNYTGNSGGAAALQYSGEDGKVVFFGFPFESLLDSTRRAQYMSDILDFFGAPEVLVPSGAVWKVEDSGADLQTAWVLRNYDDAAWKSGPAQLGFGDGDEKTLVEGNPARITTYFRHSFNVDNARKYRALRLRLLRDDGAVVWLNGSELLRSNMPAAGEILWQTQAASAVSGTNETAFFDYLVDARQLRVGNNVLAVEVHQSGTASSDLSFDLELAAARDFPSTLIASRSVWKYRDNGIAPSIDWTTGSYNDSAWLSGPARLGYGGDGEATLVGYGANIQNRYVTTWFRQSFPVINAAAFDALKVELQCDDGAAVYLNGIELLRANLPSQPIGPLTRAGVDVAGADELAWQSYIVPATALLEGVNVLAAEVHQASAASIDLGFDLRLSGLAQAGIGFAQWQSAMFGSDRSLAAAADLSDPDADNKSNLLEYAGGSLPASPDGGPSVFPSPLSGRLTLGFTRNVNATDLTIAVQASDSPAGPWEIIARSSNGSLFEPLMFGAAISEAMQGSVRAVEVSDLFDPGDPAHPTRFLRLEVTR